MVIFRNANVGKYINLNKFIKVEAPAEAKAEEAGAGTKGVAMAAAPTAAQLAARAAERRRIVHSRHTKNNHTPKPSLGRARSTKCRTGGAGGRVVLAVEARAAYLAVSVVMPAAILAAWVVTADVAVAATVAVARAAVWEEGVVWAAAAVGHQGGAASSVGRVAAAQSTRHSRRIGKMCTSRAATKGATRKTRRRGAAAARVAWVAIGAAGAGKGAAGSLAEAREGPMAASWEAVAVLPLPRASGRCAQPPRSPPQAPAPSCPQ